MNQTNNTGLALNILEVICSKGIIKIYRAPYDYEALNTYRNSYKYFYFHRDGNYIYSWEILANTFQVLPDVFESFDISRTDNSLIFNKVIETGVVQWFVKNKSIIYKLKNSSIWEVEYKKDIRDFKGLKVIPVINFSIHPFYSTQSNKFITALSIRFSSKYAFDQDESIFKGLNFDTRNLKKNAKNEIIASSANIAKFLAATGQTSAFNIHRNNINNDTYTYNQVHSIIKTFQNHIKPNIYLVDQLSISALNFHNIPNSNFLVESVTKPKYYFHQERTGSGFYNAQTQQLKPYSFDLFNGKLLKILVITPDIHEGTTGTFVKNLEQRLKDVFHLYNLKFNFLTFKNSTENYQTAISNADCSGYDLAIVTVSALDKSIPTQSSPYYVTKAKLLNERIPTQEVTVEVMRRADNLIYEAVALNIYSKLGGSAWSIEKVLKDKVEVVVGISSTVNFENERIIGFANIFDYNGNYLIGDCSMISSFADYSINLEKYLTTAIKSLIESKGLTKGDAIRLIFHLSKEAGKKHELKAIDNTIKKFVDYNVQFGIVHLSYNHNLRLYLNQGVDVPARGTFVQVSTYQGLLHLGKGTKVPIFVRLDQRSTYKDLFDTCKQVLYFCHLCYRNFRPANVPVTIKYPSLLAKLTDELNQVPRWDNNQLNRIKDKLWFI